MFRHMTALIGALVLVATAAPRPAAQGQTAQAVLQAVGQAMGTNNLKCVTYTGAGYFGIVGQNYDIRDDWARVELASYSRTINYEERSSREERVIQQGTYPARGGGGIPIQGRAASGRVRRRQGRMEPARARCPCPRRRPPRCGSSTCGSIRTAS